MVVEVVVHNPPPEPVGTSIARAIRRGGFAVGQAMERMAKRIEGAPECTRVECGAPVVMMTQKGTGFCSRLCEEYEYWEEMFDDETDTP